MRTPALLFLLAACAHVAPSPPSTTTAAGPTDDPRPRPPLLTDGETPLPALGDWRAFLLHQSDVGVWYAHVAKAVSAFGQDEVLCTDDLGRFTLLSVYSGKWTAHSVVPDGQWLAPTRPADVDPRVPGNELYGAGKGGNVHRITLLAQPFGKFVPQSVEIGHAAGEEFHAVAAGDLDPASPGDELLAFGITGAVWHLRPATGEAAGDDAFTMVRVATLPGRVRDTVLVPGDGGPTLYGAARSGDLIAARLSQEGLHHRVALHEDCGLGRIALRRGAGPTVLYVTRDDGVVLRLEATGAGEAAHTDDASNGNGAAAAGHAKGGISFEREVVFAGAQGPRGVAAGRFFADGRESIAVYGYGKEVQVVSRVPGGPWQVETIFRDAQQGHWLAVGELDGRNGTDELVATGFGGKVVLLARPPGYGLPGAAVPR
jgi:hypothetical protein